MASTKRQLPNYGERGPKKPKAETNASVYSSKPELPQRVVLNSADCDLDFNIEGSGLIGYGLHEQGFAYCWSGARANVGTTRGKYCFGCKVISAQPVDMDDTAPDQQHVCRLGISRGDDMVGNLGESGHSFGYGGTGKFSTAGRFSDYGESFGIGDTVVCCVDLESKPLASIGFSKNGKWLGTAIQFDAGPFGLSVVDSPLKELQWESALFPHVLLKNVVVQMQFSLEDGLVPEGGFKPWASAIEDRNVIVGPTFSVKKSDCEVIMMVGLPASGKTTWAEKWVKEHPEKRYVLLGTNLVLDQMKVPGLLRKKNYGERFDRLMDRATGIFNVLISRAANTPRNYIIDQTNVFKSARRRKLKPFADFQKIAVILFPKPEELQKRSEKRFGEMGKEVPPDAVNNMLANYVLPKSKDLPGSDEFFDQVMFVELNREESQKYLDQMKQDLASVSKDGTPTLPRGGSGSHCQGSYCPVSLPVDRSSRVSTVSQMTGLHGSTGSFPGVNQNYQNSFPGVNQNYQNPVLPTAAYPYGCYSNQISLPSRGNDGYCGTSGGIPRGDTRPYFNSGVGGPYSRPNTEVNNMAFPGAYPYRSDMTVPWPVLSTRTMPFDYDTLGGPFSEVGGAPRDLHTSRALAAYHAPSPTTYDSPSPYENPSPRPTYGNHPDNMQYSEGNAAWRPRYY